MQQDARSSTFSSHVSPLLKMFLAWFAALAVTGGHHAFNVSLNDTSPGDMGRPEVLVSIAQSQAGASVVGTIFAFLVSAFLSMSAGTAFIQSAWRLVQSRSFTLAGLDALWSSTHNPLAFLSFDFWKTAREVVFVAGLSWAFPLIVTFAPGTLSVQSRITPSSRECGVPTFNFSSSALYDQLNSASKPYLQPSALASRVVGATILGGQPLSPTSPCQGNCSYLTVVNAPSFSCKSGFQSTSELTWGTGSDAIPPTYVGGRFDATPPLYDIYTGWDFAGHIADSVNFLPTFSGTNFTCVTYNTTYYFHYNFTGSTSSVSVHKIILDEPASQLMLGNMSQHSSSINDPDFVGPGEDIHSAWFNTTTNYYAVLFSLYSSIVGNITMLESGDSVNFVYTPQTLAVTQSHVVSSIQNGNITWADPAAAMEALLTNITLSMLTIDPSQTSLTTCVHSDLRTYFSYDARRLWLVYGLGLGFALLCDLIGIYALLRNQFGATAWFTDFLAATRNSELNEVDFSGRMPRIRLRYGPLRDAAGRRAFAFPESLLSKTEEDESTKTRTSMHAEKAGDSYQAPLMFEPEDLYKAEDDRSTPTVFSAKAVDSYQMTPLRFD